MLKNEFKIHIITDFRHTGPKRMYCRDALSLRHKEINLAITNTDYVLYKRDETGNDWVPVYRVVSGQRKKGSVLTRTQRKKIADEAIDAFINKRLGDTK